MVDRLAMLRGADEETVGAVVNDDLPLRPKPVRSRRPEDLSISAEIVLRKRLQAQTQARANEVGSEDHCFRRTRRSCQGGLTVSLIASLPPAFEHSARRSTFVITEAAIGQRKDGPAVFAQRRRTCGGSTRLAEPLPVVTFGYRCHGLPPVSGFTRYP
ncbi:hypothetical protein [Streptomyces sp. NPDC055886]